jgi:predicted PurR-regulated permease PerM
MGSGCCSYTFLSLLLLPLLLLQVSKCWTQLRLAPHQMMQRTLQQQQEPARSAKSAAQQQTAQQQQQQQQQRLSWQQ